MNGPEDNAKRFALSSGPFIKGLMLFSLRGWEFPDHQARECTPDKCFNPPLELFLQVLDGRFRLRLFALMRVSFASKVVLMRTECWTQLVACAHNLLVLARPLVEGCYRPWENRRSELTLTQVRRAMPSLLCQLGTPARPPKPRGKAPGRTKGFHPRRRTRYPVICKTSKKQKKSKKGASV